MKRSGWIIIVATTVSFVGQTAVRGKSGTDAKIADRFEVSFRSAEYGTLTSVTRTSEGRREQATKYLRLYCGVSIADANLVLGVSERGVITQFTNGKGEIVDDLDQKLLRANSGFYSYQGLSYRKQFAPPQKPAKWKTAIRSFLRLPPLKRSRPQWVDKLAPSQTSLEIDAGLFGPDAEKISRVKGYFHVLMAESLEHVDVPFKPTEKWRRVVPGLEIKVLEAESLESRYKYRIEARREENAVQGSLSPATDLPERLAVERWLIGRDGNLTRCRIGPLSSSLSLLSAGSGVGSGRYTGPMKKFRFVIAVNPSHHKIPFVLEDILLPGSDAAAAAAASERARAAAARAAWLRAKRARTAPTRPAPRTRRKAQVVPYAPTGPMSDNIVRQTRMRLSWEPGPGASYDVYLGESFKDVNDGVNGTFKGNQNATFFIAGLSLPGLRKTSYPNGPKMSYPNGLVPGKTYYWRVDQVNSKTNSRRKGEVRSFSIAPRAAFNPFPADGAKSVDPNVTLRWTGGLRVKLHKVYFGDDLEKIKNAGDGPLQGAKTFTPGALVPGTTYYWRVDEFDPPATYKGKVWSFTVDDAAGSQKVPD